MKKILVLMFFSLVVSLLFFGILFFGPIKFPIEVVSSLLKGALGADSFYHKVFWEVRFPTALTALLASGGLAVCGLLLQTFFQNPLAGPFVLGIGSGASLGVALVSLGLGVLSQELSPLLLKLGPIGGALIGSFSLLIVLLALNFKLKGKILLLISGMLFSYLAGGVINLLSYFAHENKLKSFIMWSQGTFEKVGRGDLPLFSSLIILGTLFSFMIGKSLNALWLGDELSRSLGVSLKKIKLFIILISSFLTGIVTAFCGPIAFVGVIIPHLARKLIDSGNHFLLIPLCFILGGGLGLLSLTPSSWFSLPLPLNSVLGLVGAPILFFLVLKNSRMEVT